ncbi:hypothetical protein [Burkholderia glumae]|uniref:hypothetical protein n=1 Tax=Burkholderia glumae TaxID=337 RepID=UPI002151F742|nr:hypothetical protein [Burkholderia glumae]
MSIFRKWRQRRQAIESELFRLYQYRMRISEYEQCLSISEFPDIRSVLINLRWQSEYDDPPIDALDISQLRDEIRAMRRARTTTEDGR